MRRRLPALASLVLHAGLLFVLSLITFAFRKDEVVQAGIELELFDPGEDEEQSRPAAPESAALGDPDLPMEAIGQAETGEADVGAEPAETPLETPVQPTEVPVVPVESAVAPVVAEAPGAIVPVESAGTASALVEMPSEAVTPLAEPAPVPAMAPSGEAPGGTLVVAPPAEVRAPEQTALAAPHAVLAAVPAASGGSASRSAVAAPVSVPPRRAVNRARLAAAIAGQQPARRSGGVDLGALGRSIAQAQVTGTGRLSLRQRVNLAEMVRNQITPCWNPPEVEDAGGHVSIVLRIRLDRGGAIAEPPVVTSILGQTATNGPYARALAGSVRRAVVRCAPLRLPAELYDAWSDIELNFDPRDLR